MAVLLTATAVLAAIGGTGEAATAPLDARGIYTVSTLAGGPGSGAASTVEIDPESMDVDADGTVFELDNARFGNMISPLDHTVLRRITPSADTQQILGQETTLGVGPIFARAPGKIAADGAGGVYFTVIGGGALYRWTASSGIRRVAGNGTVPTPSTVKTDSASCGTPPPDPAATSIPDPSDLAVAADGTVYLSFDCMIWTLRNGRLARLAGVPTPNGGNFVSTVEGGQADQTDFSNISGIGAIPGGGLFVASGGPVWRIATDGTVTAATGQLPSYAPAPYERPEGVQARSAYTAAYDVVAHGDGTFDIAEYAFNDVRRVTPDGVIRTIADNVGLNRLSADARGVDYWINSGVEPVAIVSLPRPGTVVPLAVPVYSGAFGCCHSGDGGPATSARLSGGLSPLDAQGIISEPDGSVVFADLSYIRRITPDGVIHTIAGNRDSRPHAATGLGLEMNIGPHGIAEDRIGNLYFSDGTALRKMDPLGVVTTISDNIGLASSIALAVDGTVYANGYESDSILQVAPDGRVSCFASCYIPNATYTEDDGHPAATTYLKRPHALTMDPQGNLLIVAGDFNKELRRITPQGVVYTVVGGSEGRVISGGGYPVAPSSFRTGGAVTAFAPDDVVVADGPHLYSFRQGRGTGIAADVEDPSGGYGGDGGPANQATFRTITGLAHDAAGNVFVYDGYNARLRKLTVAAPPAPPVPTAPSGQQQTPIDAKYAALGSQRGILGAKVGKPYPVSGGSAQNFAKGRIYYSTRTGAHELHGAILDRYLQLGGAAALGMPTTDESFAYGRLGRFNSFTGGTIYWSRDSAAHAVTARFFPTYSRAGKEHGRLGYPTRDAYSVFGGQVVDFQGGHLIYNPVTKRITASR